MRIDSSGVGMLVQALLQLSFRELPFACSPDAKGVYQRKQFI
jgi:hypothetical protein